MSRTVSTMAREALTRERVEELALERVAQIERERGEQRRAEERERAPLIEHAREVLGEELVPHSGERLSETDRVDARSPRRAPWWAESIGLSEAEATELAGAPLKETAAPLVVPR
jgi:hypothetical protein